MLVEFRVENHRSLREEQVLTMEATCSSESSDMRPRSVRGIKEPLLPVAVLYGANASGKSNVLTALRFMRDAVVYSQRLWSAEGGVPRDPFAWGAKRAEPSLFEVKIVFQGVQYQYGFVISDEIILEEWLYAWPHGKKQTWFTRENNSFEFGEHLKGENKTIESVTRPNALFLSVASQFKHFQLLEVYRWFSLIDSVNVPTGSRTGFIRASRSAQIARLFHDNERDLFEEGMLDRFRTFLRNADIGIVDVRLLKDGDDEPRATRFPKFELKHSLESEESWLPLEEESKGTKTLFQLAMPILRAIDSGTMILVDELEASLHPSLALEIVRQFNEASTNPANGQLIFTTHDTNLLGRTLGDALLRRDQVWLTEKDSRGATLMYPLTDFKPRKSENLELGYLQGRYGAIPFLGNLQLSGE